MATGKFITFEGVDGAGKSTHITAFADALRQHGKTVVTTREPGGTPLGEKLRGLLLHEQMHLETEALLMFAARREHLAQLIMPALVRGDWVISDRFTDATFAYQGGGRGLSLDKLSQLEHWVQGDLQPDLTLLFDVPLEVARERLQNSRDLDKFEQEQEDFFVRVRQVYLQRAAQFPERIRLIDSTRPIADISREVQQFAAELCGFYAER
ncbi:MAG: dTMP kinase [Betaproteobacteria bacterium]|nr:dTMP kinase [Betaproteobacteria bacterium]